MALPLAPPTPNKTGYYALRFRGGGGVVVGWQWLTSTLVALS